MSELHIKAVIAGIFFGVWPLCMNRSGLSGNVSSACYGIAVLMGVLPFALYSNGLSVPSANWSMVLYAGICGAIGLMCFNSMLAGASLQNVGFLFVLMTVVQIAVAASYQVVMDGSLSPTRIGGYITAMVAVYLLFR